MQLKETLTRYPSIMYLLGGALLGMLRSALAFGQHFE